MTMTDSGLTELINSSAASLMAAHAHHLSHLVARNSPVILCLQRKYYCVRTLIFEQSIVETDFCHIGFELDEVMRYRDGFS